uniref:Uncharacterized protein n=1 Tax=Helicotheca tamesis TaxID=374047 RepID=A0A7S2H0P7_9STRA|mmetsp:Transcript_14111/g.19309  ORF Transcript_14111/g.19309 Transcript_14111/m.19309 type:complete len:140 (+) Transcript_14111:3-422(+)
MFGKYSTHVPVLKTDRYRDVPLPASTASPYTPEEYSTAQLAMEEAGSNLKRLEGQNVQGVMIPRQVDGVEKVTKGQKVSSTRKLKKGSLAAKVLGAEAEKSAIPKIGKVMLVATVAAWAGFPVIKSVAQSTATQVMSFF